MHFSKLTSEALWQAVRSLTAGELKIIQHTLNSKRIRWLLRTLRNMKIYSEYRLTKAYKRAFPNSDIKLISSYKYKLWLHIQSSLPNIAPEVSEEVEIWQQLWMSSILWQRGLTEPARILWHKAIHLAIDRGWYEVALWGVALLEMYMRDPHIVAPSEKLADWSHRLLRLVQSRYKSITKKFASLETYVRSRSGDGWHFPDMPPTDAWAEYMNLYSQFLNAADHSKFLDALEYIQGMLQNLKDHSNFPSAYRNLHFFRGMLNMGVHMLNLYLLEFFNHWTDAWRHLWRNVSTPTGRYLELYQLGLGLQLTYYLHKCDWQNARQFYERERQNFHQLVIISTESIRFRIQIGLHIFLVLLLTRAEPQEVHRWNNWIRQIIQRENFQDYPYPWWAFLEWYAVYRERRPTRLYHRYLKVRQVWSRYMNHQSGCKPVLELLRRLSLSFRKRYHKWAAVLLKNWEDHPEEYLFWQQEANFFPMKLFLYSVLSGKQLEDCPPLIPQPTPIPSRLYESIKKILQEINSHKLL
ncbi:MAG: hypothetical protein RML92_09130 [Bacteroidia bacterium]|nr:hypothetical protein [Bacteroidia bacterium]